MSKPRPNRGAAALRSAVKDLAYEWQTARDAVRALVSARQAGNTALSNMFIEDFLLHARNLRDFFAPRGKPDDVLAKDFLGRHPRIALPHLRSAAVRNRLNRRIAHLSYSRPRFRVGWNIPRLLAEIEAAMEAFALRLESKRPRLARILRNVN